MGKTTITLASGNEMPMVGFGLWKVPTETCADIVYNVKKSFSLGKDDTDTGVLGDQGGLPTFRRGL